MANRKKIIGYTALAIGVGAIVYMFINKRKNTKLVEEINEILDGQKEDPSKKPDGGQVVLGKTDYDKLPVGKFPLKIGDKNKKVYDLQKYLNANYGSNLDLDGKFGQGMYSVLCNNFWTLCGTSVGYYGRSISQSDFDEIKNYRK